MSGPGSKLAPTPAADKSKFLHRLSLFLKQNGNYIPHPNLIIDANYSSHTTETFEATTMDLLSNIQEDPDPAPDPAPAPAPAGDKSADIINLPHEYFILESSSYEVQNSTNKAATSCSKPVKDSKTAQMTIFYGGQVLVLDDVSADRARDLMLMTNNGRYDNDKKRIDENHHVELAKKDSDLPIARRASLHKFLAKRKDREPHNYHCPGGGGSSSSASGKEHSFDLNM